jgi:23S rRNA (uridine2552-2'-O)-methyltransferase
LSRRSKSSGRWLAEHEQDAYVRRARTEGWRSRAVFKLMEIQRRERLLRHGMTCIDLGASPGGWSQFAARAVGPRGRVIALDILPLAPLAGVEFVHGDFNEPAVVETLIGRLAGGQADLVLSDMAPNLSGMAALDQPRAMELAERAHDLAQQVLRPGGDFLVKVFQGENFDAFRGRLRGTFGSVKACKPPASRARSSELYLLARNYGMV